MRVKLDLLMTLIAGFFLMMRWRRLVLYVEAQTKLEGQSFGNQR